MPSNRLIICHLFFQDCLCNIVLGVNLSSDFFCCSNLGGLALHLPSRCSAPCSLQQQPSHSSTLLSQAQLPTSLSADMLLPCLKLNHLEKSTAAWKAQGKPKKVGCCSEMGGRDEVLRCKWSVRPVGAAAAPTQHHSPPSFLTLEKVSKHSVQLHHHQ